MRTIKVSLKPDITFSKGMRVVSFFKMMFDEVEMDDEDRVIIRIHDPREYLFFIAITKAFGEFALYDVSDDLGALDEEPKDAAPDGTTVESEGYLYGTIGTERIGTGGFGYDPLFFPEGSSRTLAEYTAEEKNAISHRAEGLRGLLEKL